LGRNIIRYRISESPYFPISAVLPQYNLGMFEADGHRLCELGCGDSRAMGQIIVEKNLVTIRLRGI
jgi:hypothetical protein